MDPYLHWKSTCSSRGKITLGSIIRTANRLKNAKNLSKEGLRQEGSHPTGAIGRIETLRPKHMAYQILL